MYRLRQDKRTALSKLTFRRKLNLLVQQNNSVRSSYRNLYFYRAFPVTWYGQYVDTKVIDYSQRTCSFGE